MNNIPASATNRLRYLGIAEGISLLVLLFIAMPLKYLLDMPAMVKIVGWMHGVLFVVFVAVLFLFCIQHRSSLKIFVLGFIAAFVPFGTFVFDGYLRRRLSSNQTTR